VAGDILVLDGRLLQAEGLTTARVGGNEVNPSDLSAERIKVPLSTPTFPVDRLRAGVQGIQVIQYLNMGTPETPHQGFESNVAAFVLRPTVTPGAVTIDASTVIDTVTYRDATIPLTLDPKIGLDQRLVILLNEFNPPPNRPARAYRFEIKLPAPPPDPIGTVNAQVKSVAAGNYLLRVQVDGAESPLDPGPDPDDPKYIGPLVTI
jgi:hypothetical protein